MTYTPASVPAPCADAIRRMGQLLDGDLDDVERSLLEAHLAWCIRCCGELAFARELRRLLRTRTTVELPADVGRRLDRLIDELDDGDPVVPR